MADNLTPKPITQLPPRTAPDVRPKTAFEKLSDDDRAAINKLNSNANILQPDTTAEGLEKAIIVAGKTINDVRGKMDDLFFGKFEIAAAEESDAVNPMTGFKETLDKGIFYVMDKLLEVDMCNILEYALNQIPGGTRFDPTKSPEDITDPLARKKYELQYKAYQVQVLIDDFYSLYGDNNTSKKKNALVGLIKKVRTILEEVLGIPPQQVLSPEQQIEQEASGLSLEDSLKFNTQAQAARELFSTDGIRNAELVAAFPELQLFSNFMEDVYRVFNKYSDVRNFPSQDVQKILRKVDDVRTIAISIQNLTTVSGAINLADRFLDGRISKFIKMISKIIDPKKIVPFLKTIIDVCRVIIRIANTILRFVSFFSNIISLFLLLVKVFWILRKFFLGVPIPNMFTTVGVTTVASDTLQEIIKEKGFLFFLKRLKQINQLLQTIIGFLRSLVTKLFTLVEKITALIFNIEACYADSSELLDPASTLQSELDQYSLDQLAGGGSNINPNNRSGGATGGAGGTGGRAGGGNASGLNNNRGRGNEQSATTLSGRVLDANANGNGFGVINVGVDANDLNARRRGTYIDPALLQEFKDVRDLIRDRAQRLLEFLNNYFDKKNAKNNTFGPYTIEILTEESVDTEIRLRRRYGIAIDNKGILATQSDATYASDDKVIIAEVKAKLLALGLVNTGALGYAQKSNVMLNGLGGTNANGQSGASGLRDPLMTGLGNLAASKQGQNINQNGGTSQTLGLGGVASNNQSTALNKTNADGSPVNLAISNASIDGIGTGLDQMTTNIAGDDYGNSLDSFLSEDARRKQTQLEGQKNQSGGNQPNLGFSGFSANDIAVMEESMNFLTDEDITIDDIEFMDFDTGDDDPDSEDEDPPTGLGINGFINSIKGGKKLRKRMRKMMAKASTDLANNLKQTDPGGKYGGKIANKQANKEAIAEKKNKISDLKEQVSNWNKEKEQARVISTKAYDKAKKDLNPKIEKNEREIKQLEAEIKQLEGGQSVSTTNQSAQSSTNATGGGASVSYAGDGRSGDLTSSTRSSATLR